MLKILINVWVFIFARPYFVKLNKLLFMISIHGLGILNYRNNYLSGEEGWLKSKLAGMKEPVVFDVGANIGDYISLVLNANEGAKIYAFEPHPKNLVRIRSRYGSDLRVSIAPCAVGDACGKLELYDYLNNDGSSHASLYRDVIEKIHSKQSVSHSVDVVSLDDFCLDKGISHISLLKIDTEGNELKCLRGARRLLECGVIDAIHFEFNEMNVISHSTFKDFWDILDQYKIYRLLPGGGMLPIEKYSALSCELYAYQNIVALRKS